MDLNERIGIAKDKNKCFNEVNDENSLLKAMNESKVDFLRVFWTSIEGRLRSQEFYVPILSSTEKFTIDGSSFPGWQSIENSDLILKPDYLTTFVDPLNPDIANIIATVYTPDDFSYQKCPRATMIKTMENLDGRKVNFGPEPEFFLFEEGKIGEVRGNSSYMGTGILDPYEKVRRAMIKVLNVAGIKITKGHAEVGALQQELGIDLYSGVEAADKVQIFKHYVHAVAREFNLLATFMPKPVSGENGNGMHINVSMSNGIENIFGENINLSDKGYMAINGVLNYANAMVAFSNPSINSYKRLVPGYEAPNGLVASMKNRSAGIRVPAFRTDKEVRFEVRWGDPIANPYLYFSALSIAMNEGIYQGNSKVQMINYDLFENPKRAEEEGIKYLVGSLDEALIELKKGREIFEKVFSPELIDSYIEVKQKEIEKAKLTVTPLELEMYFNG